MGASREHGRPGGRLVAVLAAAVVLGCSAGHDLARAVTWSVHADGTGDAPTIQAAVDSAAVGDTVLVSTGLYHDLHEDLAGEFAVVLMKSGVKLRSVEGAVKTVIDAKSPNPSRGISLRNCDSTTVVEGFTITGGDAFTAAGLLVEGGAPSIIDNVIFDAYGGTGAGMHVKGGAAPVISGNVFDLNEACCGIGGGLLVQDASSPEVVGNRFTRNSSFGGGGIAIQNSSGLYENNYFFDNSGTDGGAFAVWSSTPIIRGNTFVGNHCTSGGGAVSFQFTEGGQFYDNLVAANTAGGSGGGILVEGAWPEVARTTIVGNSAGQGGGIFIRGDSAPEFERVVVAFNSGSGGVVCESSTSSPVFSCSDVFGNEGGDFGGQCADPTGTDGNFSSDPLLCDLAAGDYTLCANSPCTPGGHPDGWDCGLIGALPADCDDCSTPAERTSWGALKAIFR